MRAPAPSSKVWITTLPREDGSSKRYEGDKLMVGKAAAGEIEKLIRQIGDAGWFQTPLTGLSTDVPTLEIEVFLKGKKEHRWYQGEDLKGPRVRLHELTEADLKSLKTWHTVRKAIGKVVLQDLVDYKGDPPVYRPHDYWNGTYNGL